MVFHSLIEKKETPEQPLDVMASSTTVKSQPLHNFSLPDLKWAMNHTNTHRFRKLSDSSHKSPSNDADGESGYPKQNPVPEGMKIGDGIDKSDKKKSTVLVSTDDLVENSEKKPNDSSDGSRSKVFLRIRTKNTKTADEVADTGDHIDAAEEPVPKTWNLRPRKVIAKVSNNDAIGGGAVPDNKAQPSSRPELTRNRNILTTETKVPEKKEKEKEKKQKFSISLSKEEIENDFLILTGSKPARRPKKRAKNVQNQLDFAFPGLWLASITPDSYRVNDGPAKG
ncbi:uncharacterized protein LOC123223685 [Mangifera indica]|uniref:uncharacterized protein LOC123223685 n=1 Tax=Mangifera indica TaxID=29780 RepID=UPI001CFADE7A|nr:uncharacterized protein LOC123223685 [Mangifera indica]